MSPLFFWRKKTIRCISISIISRHTHTALSIYYRLYIRQKDQQKVAVFFPPYISSLHTHSKCCIYNNASDIFCCFRMKYMKRKKKTFSWDDDDSGACGRVLYKIHTQVMGIVVVIITYPLATHNTKSHDSFFLTYFEAFCRYMYYYIKSWIYIGCCCCLVSSFVSFLFSSLEYTDTAISQRIKYTHESLFFLLYLSIFFI